MARLIIIVLIIAGAGWFAWDKLNDEGAVDGYTPPGGVEYTDDELVNDDVTVDVTMENPEPDTDKELYENSHETDIDDPEAGDVDVTMDNPEPDTDEELYENSNDDTSD